MTDAAVNTAALQNDAVKLFSKKRRLAFAVPAIILAYLVYVFFAFDIPGLAQRASMENAQSLVRDTYSHKVHVTRDNRDGSVGVSIEGERKGRYPEGTAPEWVELGETTVIDLGDGHLITYGPEIITYDVPGYGLMEFEVTRSQGVVQSYPSEEIPEWINASRNRVAITTEAGRLTVTRNRTEVFRYFAGWELFFFTLDSPYHGLSVGQVAGRAFSGEAGEIFDDFWNNAM